MASEPVKFLLVDDLEENLLALEGLLRREGLIILKAGSGPEALELLLLHDVALVILDVQMPGMDGFEVAELMRGTERTRRVPIVFLTAGAMDTQRRFRGYEAGAVDFLFKPVEPHILQGKANVFFELKRAEIALKESAVHARRIIDHTLAFVGVLSLDGTVMEANATALRSGDLRREDVVGRPFWDCYWWAYDERVQERLRAALTRAAAGEVVRYDEVVRMAGDTRMPIDFMIAPVRRETGQITYLIPSGIDITDRKEAEEKLRRAHTLLEGIARGTGDLIAAQDTEGRCLFCNEAYQAEFERIFGSRITVGCNLLEALAHRPEDQRNFEALWARAVQGEAFTVTEEFGEGDSERIVFDVRFYPLRDEGGQIVGAAHIARNITERVRAQEELRRARDELARTNTSLERKVQERTAKLQETIAELEHFSYTITHDMRAPLRSMEGFGKILVEEYAESLDETGKDFLRRIVESARRMDHLITDALNYSKVVREEIILEPIDLGALLRGLIESYPEFQRPHAAVEVLDGIPDVMGNRAALTQCFSNLLGNAVKFVEPGRVPTVRVWGDVLPPSQTVRIWVEDNGIGVPSQYHGKIFEMFQRLSKVYPGTGIGLALVKKVVERMKGRVGVESETPNGSRFWVELKAADFAGADHPSGTPAGPVPSWKARGS